MSGGSSKSKSKPEQIAFDEFFRSIQNVGEGLLTEALGATRDQRGFQSDLFELLAPELKRAVASSSNQFESEEDRISFLKSSLGTARSQDENSRLIGDRLTDSALNLGNLTDEDSSLISSTINSAREVGQSQIDQFVAEGFRGGNEIAAARGLRPTDAPIGNVRGRIGEESIRQKGRLESTLAGQEASLKLQLPLQRLGALTGAAGQSQGAADSSSAFQAALQQNADANRLNLASLVGQSGLGIVGLGGSAPGLLGASAPAFGTKSKTNSAQGGLLSMRAAKYDNESVESADILKRLMAMPIEKWRYVWENGSDAFHIGPYADDFKRLFAGDGVTIDIATALGVSMVSIQELAGRLEAVERKVASMAV